MTAAYLALRFVLFGQVVRESQLNAEGLAFFGRLFAASPRARRRPAMRRPALPRGRRGRRRRRGVRCCCADVPPDDRRRRAGLLIFFGPVWWVIGVAPTAVAGYESPRHVYLAAAGWAIVLGIVADLAWSRARTLGGSALVSAAALAVCAFYAVRLHGVVAEWNRMAAVSHQAVMDVRGEVLSSPPGTLIIAGAPTRSWEWAVPFSVQAAVHPHRPDRARVHRHALAAALLPRPVVRRHPPHPARLGGAPRRRADRRAALEPGHRSAVEGHRSRVSCLEDASWRCCSSSTAARRSTRTSCGWWRNCRAGRSGSRGSAVESVVRLGRGCMGFRLGLSGSTASSGLDRRESAQSPEPELRAKRRAFSPSP